MTVTLIIPAYNEAERIGRVLEAVALAHGIDEMIVVDDGSSDGTSDVVRAFGQWITILRKERNEGKAQAMLDGAHATVGEVLCFLDADLRGLAEADIQRLVLPIVDGSADMSIAYRNGESAFFRYVVPGEPMLGGERCLRKDDFLAIMEAYHPSGYEIEIAMNRYFLPRRISIVQMESLTQAMKQEKFGFWRGWGKDVRLFYGFIRRFGLPEVIRQAFLISYRFLWLRSIKGWKEGRIVL